MIGRSMILASAETITAGATVVYPGNRLNIGDWASEVTFTIDVQSATGTGTLVVKVQSVMPHTTGNQYLNERIFDIDGVQKVNLTAEGEDWPSPICTQASSFPVTVQRTYVGFGKDLRLSLTSTSTLVPVVSIVLHAKGIG